VKKLTIEHCAACSLSEQGNRTDLVVLHWKTFSRAETQRRGEKPFQNLLLNKRTNFNISPITAFGLFQPFSSASLRLCAKMSFNFF